MSWRLRDGRVGANLQPGIAVCGTTDRELRKDAGGEGGCTKEVGSPGMQGGCSKVCGRESLPGKICEPGQIVMTAKRWYGGTGDMWKQSGLDSSSVAGQGTSNRPAYSNKLVYTFQADSRRQWCAPSASPLRNGGQGSDERAPVQLTCSANFTASCPLFPDVAWRSSTWSSGLLYMGQCNNSSCRKSKVQRMFTYGTLWGRSSSAPQTHSLGI